MQYITEHQINFKIIRTEVRGDFNIHATNYFLDTVFHQKSKTYDVLSLLYFWLAKKPRSLHELWKLLVMTEKAYIIHF